ncbi:c-type cytochrome [Ramlibacter rhizophilus]|uniref:Cytochrome c4 n=1 Tax=Ramlibacter rhizophilus TaxID=1781167 RepID=A0A4Z0BJU5_9BURK|nr:c-type cytochrome [Ramlibacter rhizophilus]TFY99592.1 cytochrome c4 [Ramlibacter rhizophilus]
MKLPASLLLAALLAAPVMSSAQQSPQVAPGPADAPAAPTTPKQPVKPDLAQGEQRYTAVCAACHGADGNSGAPANPKLAGQHPQYLVKQLYDFKTGKRPSPIMQGFAAQLSDQEMRNISYWLSTQKPKDGFARDKEAVALGERIWRGGLADRGIAACAGCHSPNGAGIPAVYPRLAGQHADYTVSQLMGFRDGKRPNNVIMHQVAAKMTDREIRAVSDYVAGLR